MAKQERAPRAEKVRTVDELAGLLARSGLVVLTDYRGLTVADLAGLRRKLREQGVDYRVTKNTLLGFAADKADRPAVKEVLVGPTAVAFGDGDITVLARTLGDYERTSKVFKIKAGLLGKQLLRPADVLALSTLPTRPVLLSQVVAGFQAPISGLVGVLGGVLSGLVGTLDARRRQLEEQQGAAPAE